MTRFIYLGLACLLSATVLTGPVQAAGEGALKAAKGMAYDNPIADATPMPLPRFYARHVEEGNKLLMQNRLTEAMDEFFTAKNINPDYYPAYIGNGDAYQKMGQLDKAMENYQTAIRLLNPSYASDRILRANYYADRREFRAALRDYGDVLRVDPAAGNQFTVAMKELRHDEPKKAVKAFEEAIRLDDDYPDPHFQLGNLYFRDNKLKKAIPPYEMAVKIEPDNPLYRFALGTSYYKDGTSKRKPDMTAVAKATTQFEHALRLGMALPRLQHNLGTCYVLTGNYDGAVEHLRLAVKGGLQDSETFYNFGNALYRKGMTINYTWDGLSSLTDPNKLALNNAKFNYLLQAVKSYKLTIRLKENYAQVHYDLGVAYYRLSELKLTEPFMADMLRDPESQKNYFTKGVTFFPQDMLWRSLQSFGTFISLSQDEKAKNNTLKVMANLEKQLKDIGGKALTNSSHG